MVVCCLSVAEKLLNSEGRELRRALFSLKQIFQVSLQSSRRAGRGPRNGEPSETRTGRERWREKTAGWGRIEQRRQEEGNILDRGGGEADRGYFYAKLLARRVNICMAVRASAFSPSSSYLGRRLPLSLASSRSNPPYTDNRSPLSRKFVIRRREACTSHSNNFRRHCARQLRILVVRVHADAIPS